MKEEILDETAESDSKELIEVNLMKFINEISALDETLPLQRFLLDTKRKLNLEKLKDISIDPQEVEEEDGIHLKYTINLDRLEEHETIERQLERIDIAGKIIPRNHIVALISQYDAFLGELMRIIYSAKPNLIRKSNKDLKVEDLFIHTSLDEIKLKIIDKEIDSLLREEHCEQLNAIARRVSSLISKDFSLTSKFETLPKFAELTQRRNLFVHTNGHVTPQYLLHKRKFNFDTEGDSLNQELKASPQYCKSAFNILFEVAVKLSHILWRTLLPESIEASDENINEIIYDLLKNKRYKLGVEISNFATSHIWKHSNQLIRKYIVINKLIALKRLDNKGEMNEIIEQEDWSIGNEFKLARLVLEDKFDEAKDLMLKIDDTSEMFDRDAYKTFVLFDDFRQTPQFLDAYKLIFKEDFIIERETSEPTKRIATEEEE